MNRDFLDSNNPDLENNVTEFVDRLKRDGGDKVNMKISLNRYMRQGSMANILMEYRLKQSNLSFFM